MNQWSLVAALTLLAVSCGGQAPAGPVAPPGDVEQEVAAVAQTNRLDRASQLFFDWSAQEPDFRGSGSGVARLEPPNKARLDLFLDNGEQVAEAVLVGDELRIPSWVEVGVIPPAPLLWASLGVFSPGQDADLIEGRGGASKLDVEYLLPSGERIRYSLEGRRVTHVSVIKSGDVIRTMSIADPDGASRYPEGATYRDLPDFRELKVQLESVEYVDSFPSDIWRTPSR